MAHAVASTASRLGAHAVALPQRMKVLFITTAGGAGSWLTEAFAADGAAQIVLEETLGVTAGLARLRDEVFDAILVSHGPGELDAIELAAALRTGGHDEPLIIIGAEPPAAIDALSYEAGADDYCCLAETTVRGLLWKFARAIQRFTLSRENRRLVQAERQRLQHEHHEAERLLDQQRALIADLEELSAGRRAPAESLSLPLGGDGESESPPTNLAADGERGSKPQASAPLQLPAALVDHYRELLRAYVIMGAGNLSGEMSALATLLADTNVSAQRAMQLHVHVLEELVQGLGNRSARHVMNRADLLALEVMSHLADGYRQRYHERRYPPQQQLLPGFDVAAA